MFWNQFLVDLVGVFLMNLLVLVVVFCLLWIIVLVIEFRQSCMVWMVLLLLGIIQLMFFGLLLVLIMLMIGMFSLLVLVMVMCLWLMLIMNRVFGRLFMFLMLFRLCLSFLRLWLCIRVFFLVSLLKVLFWDWVFRLCRCLID